MEIDNDFDYLYMVAPLVGSWVNTWILGKISDEHINKVWFFPENWLFVILWAIIYIIVGVLIFKAKQFKDTAVIWSLGIYSVLSYLWQYFFTSRDIEKSINILFIMLAISIISYTEIIFSKMLNDDTLSNGYAHFAGILIAWSVYLLTIFTHSKPMADIPMKISSPIILRNSTPLPED